MFLIRRIWDRVGLSPLDPTLRRTEVLATLVKIAMAGLRGLRCAARTTGPGYLLIGKRVKVRSPQRLWLGGLVFVEDGVELQATASEGVRIGRGVTIGRDTQVRPSGYYGRPLGGGLVVGDGSNIGPMSYIGCAGMIEIGSQVMMGPGVMLLAEQHGFEDETRPMKDQGVSRQGIVIEDDVWLGAGSRILDGVRIGRGAIVATGAVVTVDVAPYTIVGGVPAKVLRSRSPDHG